MMSQPMCGKITRKPRCNRDKARSLFLALIKKKKEEEEEEEEEKYRKAEIH